MERNADWIWVACRSRSPLFSAEEVERGTPLSPAAVRRAPRGSRARAGRSRPRRRSSWRGSALGLPWWLEAPADRRARGGRAARRAAAGVGWRGTSTSTAGASRRRRRGGWLADRVKGLAIGIVLGGAALTAGSSASRGGPAGGRSSRRSRPRVLVLAARVPRAGAARAGVQPLRAARGRGAAGARCVALAERAGAPVQRRARRGRVAGGRGRRTRTSRGSAGRAGSSSTTRSSTRRPAGESRS